MGRPMELLTERSADGSLVVVGRRGLGGVSGLLLGSVSVGLVSHAKYPVVVRRGEDHQTDAGERAPMRVHPSSWASTVPRRARPCWPTPTKPPRRTAHSCSPYTPGDSRPRTPGSSHTSTWTPGTKHDQHMRSWKSAHARLLVVGARGHGGMAGLLGSTSRALIHRASCPVAVRSTPGGGAVIVARR
jgi:nucleotide-binding universal stress UspA family protein